MDDRDEVKRLDEGWARSFDQDDLSPPHVPKNSAAAPVGNGHADRRDAKAVHSHDEHYDEQENTSRDPFVDPGGDLATAKIQRVDKSGTDDKNKSDEKPDGGDKKASPWSTTKKFAVFGSIGIALLIAVLLALLWWLNARHFEKTDDAFIDAHYERVAPQIAGRVIEILVDDNTAVEPGRTLFKIDPRDYQAALDQAQAAVAQAQGNVAQAQAQREVALANVEQARADVENAQATLDNASSQLERYQGLSREALSPQRLDDLRTAERNGRAQLSAATKRQSSQAAQITLADSQIKAAQAGETSARAQVEQAELNLSYTTVKATAGGRVTNRMLQVGDYVSPGQQVLVLVPTEVFVTANFKETQLADMRIGQPVTITADAFSGVEFRGHVDSFQAGAGQVFSLLPPQNATGNYVKVVQRVPVKIVFDERGSENYKRLGPGMSVLPSVRVR